MEDKSKHVTKKGKKKLHRLGGREGRGKDEFLNRTERVIEEILLLFYNAAVKTGEKVQRTKGLGIRHLQYRSRRYRGKCKQRGHMIVRLD